MESTAPIFVSINVSSLPPKATTYFPGKCFSCQQQGHRSQKCPNKKLTLLAKETSDVEEIKENMVGCAFKDLEYLPKISADPYFNYGDDCYEVPVPVLAIFRSEIQPIWGE